MDWSDHCAEEPDGTTDTNETEKPVQHPQLGAEASEGLVEFRGAGDEARVTSFRVVEHVAFGAAHSLFQSHLAVAVEVVQHGVEFAADVGEERVVSAGGAVWHARGLQRNVGKSE